MSERQHCLGHSWKQSAKRERCCLYCGAVMCWSDKDTAWSWGFMPFEEGWGDRIADALEYEA